MNPPPPPPNFEAADWLQLAVFILAWVSVIAYAVWFIRLCVIRGDLLTRYETYVDQHEDVRTFTREFIPPAQQVGRSERSLREKLARHGR